MDYLKLTEFLEDRKLAGSAYDEHRFQQEAEAFASTHPANEAMQKMLRHVARHGNAVFLSWTAQNDALRQFLEQGSPVRPFRDEERILEHTFIRDYRRFISPFLAPLILRYKDSESFGERSRAASFLVLLDDDARPLIESEATRHLLNDLRVALSAAETATEERELVRLLAPFLDEDIIRFVNHLSRASYAAKLEFVDALLEVINYPACTLRYANFLLKAVGQIELHSEHFKKLVELRSGLRNGDVRVKNHGRKRSTIGMRQVLFGVLLLLIGGTTFWIFYSDPFKKVDDPEEPEQKTAFSQFSVEDRVKLDSLIATLEDDSGEEPDEIDPFVYLQSIDLTFREAFDNETMEELVTKLDAFYKAPFPDSSTHCASFTKAESAAYLYPGFKALSDKRGQREVVFKNQSDYEVMVFVFLDVTGGSAYMQCVPSGRTITFRSEAAEKFMAIPGNALSEKEGSSAGASFCQYDLRTLEFLHTVETFNHSTKDARIMAVGKKGSYFSIVDLRKSFN